MQLMITNKLLSEIYIEWMLFTFDKIYLRTQKLFIRIKVNNV